jgi:hypothetical protein
MLPSGGEKSSIQKKLVFGEYAWITALKWDPARRTKPVRRWVPVSAQCDLRCLGQMPPFSSRTEGVQPPEVLRFVMAQYKAVAVLRADTKINRIRRIPLIFHFRDFEYLAAQSKPCRALTASISGIAFDAHFAHRRLPWPAF